MRSESIEVLRGSGNVFRDFGARQPGCCTVEGNSRGRDFEEAGSREIDGSRCAHTYRRSGGRLLAHSQCRPGPVLSGPAGFDPQPTGVAGGSEGKRACNQNARQGCGLMSQTRTQIIIGNGAKKETVAMFEIGQAVLVITDKGIAYNGFVLARATGDNGGPPAYQITPHGASQQSSQWHRSSGGVSAGKDPA